MKYNYLIFICFNIKKLDYIDFVYNTIFGNVLNYVEKYYRSLLLQSVVCLFELPEDETVYSEDILLQDDNDNSYEAGYSQLAFASETEYDPLQGK